MPALPRRTALIVAGLALVALGCKEPTGPTVTFPFDPSGVWEGLLDGTLGATDTTETFTLDWMITERYASSSLQPIAKLEGTWTWAGVSGELLAFWSASQDDISRVSGSCPGVEEACSVKVALYPPDGVCNEIDPTTPDPIFLFGWFEGDSVITAAAVQGVYREFQDDPPPCVGPVVVAFDTTSATLTPTG